MTSSKPYLIRALYEWITDNGLTPHILVKADKPHCIVPQEFVKKGEIVLNIAMTATDKLVLGNEAIEFQARFSGKARHVYIPVNAVIAIYARENEQGMTFAEENFPEGPATPPPSPPPKGRPNLKIVE